MALDLDKLSPQARAAYINLGRHFGSPDTIAQASRTLAGHAKFSAYLGKFGFAPRDAVRLAEARDALVAAGGDREGAVGVNKISRTTYARAVAGARAARNGGRAVLEAVRAELVEQGSVDAVVAVTRIDAALAQTRLGAEDDKLADQLDVLRAALGDATVAAEATDRGGPEAVADLVAAAPALRDAAKTRPAKPGTPAATEKLDLLDGIIVTLARRAHKAARVAAKRLGMPAIASEMDLSALPSSK